MRERKYHTLIIQQNIARRIEPTANLNKLLDVLYPFSYLCRTREYLEARESDFTISETYEYVHSLLNSEGYLPRILPIALLQEPMLADGYPTGFDSKLVLFGDRNPRSIIVTLKNTEISVIEQLSHRDNCSALLFSRDRKTCITSFYHDINNPSPPIDVDSLKVFSKALLSSRRL